jgi:hypothetical protein
MISELPIKKAKLKRKRCTNNKLKEIVGIFQNQMKTLPPIEVRIYELVKIPNSLSDEGNDK